jgi:hypothetical protein
MHSAEVVERAWRWEDAFRRHIRAQADVSRRPSRREMHGMLDAAESKVDRVTGWDRLHIRREHSSRSRGDTLRVDKRPATAAAATTTTRIRAASTTGDDEQYSTKTQQPNTHDVPPHLMAPAAQKSTLVAGQASATIEGRTAATL